MAEVLRAAVGKVELGPIRDSPDPIVLKGITLAPKHGVRVVVERTLSPARKGAAAELGVASAA